MKRLIIMLCLVGLLAALPMSHVAIAEKGDTPANDNPKTLYLYEKDADWYIVWDGAWGKMNLRSPVRVTFNGHGLTADTDYTLIIYNEWPNATIIGSGTANKGGNVNIRGSAELESGDKVWLVLSCDRNDNDQFIAWNPSEYLFEHNRIP